MKELYQINSIFNKEKRLYRKEEMLGKIRFMNYLFTRINELDILSDKQYKVLFMQIEVIYKYLNGWMNSERKYS